MKKRSGYLVFMLALFFLASANSVHAQQVDSEVEIGRASCRERV